MASRVRAPEFLGVSGRALWDEIVSSYELRPDELRTLEDACAATDLLDAFVNEWRELGSPSMTRGSTGQLVEHPLVGSVDRQRKARQAFIKQLKLPDAPGTPRPNQQRDAANARWAKAHGSSA